MEDLRGRRAAVVGLGLFGGGEGAVRYLCERGARVTVMDLKSRHELEPAVKRLSDLPVCFNFGGHNESALQSSDLVVLNPAVPRNAQVVDLACQSAVPLTSPMNMFLSLCRAPVVAVTGSAGKSTTTSMLALMLDCLPKKIYMGGNIGISMLGSSEKIGPEDIVVLELSSVQLEDAAALPFSPHVSVVTNIRPNHLDRYADFNEYVEAKKNIIKFQKGGDLAVFNRECGVTNGSWTNEVKGELLCFDGSGRTPAKDFQGGFLDGESVMLVGNHRKELLFKVHDLPLPGLHNLKNAMAAAVAAKWMGADEKHIRSALKQFKPLEHRLERCGLVNGIAFYNDSDSTTPDSTMAAIESFPPPITLICGGRDKGLSFSELTQAIVDKVDVLITLGQCGPMIAQLTREAGAGKGSAPIIIESVSLSDAVQKSFSHSMPGSTVLFSPSCSSFDMFQNFADRGRAFKRLVCRLSGRIGNSRASA